VVVAAFVNNPIPVSVRYFEILRWSWLTKYYFKVNF